MPQALDSRRMRETAPAHIWPYMQPCGCNLETGRCADHAAKMARIHQAWFDGSLAEFDAVEAHCDGFAAGAGSFGDWSGVRDSSPAAVDAMFAAVEKAR